MQDTETLDAVKAVLKLEGLTKTSLRAAGAVSITPGYTVVYSNTEKAVVVGWEAGNAPNANKSSSMALQRLLWAQLVLQQKNFGMRLGSSEFTGRPILVVE